MTRAHIPVLLQEVLAQLAPSDGTYIDATFGAGGYSRAILEASPKANVIALDRDDTVKQFADAIKAEFKERFNFVHTSYDKILDAAKNHKIDGIVYDLGVSSMQLDNKERGFSFDGDHKLDMRMDSSQSLSAYEVVNEYAEEALANLIYNYGDEPKSRAIASKIVWHRTQNGPISTTKALAEIVTGALRKFYKGYSKTNPATRTFQAIRIEVNNELNQLKASINQAAQILQPTGRLVCVTFHSGEDKIVKKMFNSLTGTASSADMEFDPILQRYVMQKKQAANFVKLTKKVIKPGNDEVSSNIRARSAKLRAIEKLEATR